MHVADCVSVVTEDAVEMAVDASVASATAATTCCAAMLATPDRYAETSTVPPTDAVVTASPSSDATPLATVEDAASVVALPVAVAD